MSWGHASPHVGRQRHNEQQNLVVGTSIIMPTSRQPLTPWSTPNTQIATLCSRKFPSPHTPTNYDATGLDNDIKRSNSTENEISEAAANLLLLKAKIPSHGGDSSPVGMNVGGRPMDIQRGAYPDSPRSGGERRIPSMIRQGSAPLAMRNLLANESDSQGGEDMETDDDIPEIDETAEPPNQSSKRGLLHQDTERPEKMPRRKTSSASKVTSTPPTPSQTQPSKSAKFSIRGTQGQLEVCEYRRIKNAKQTFPYMLVRLRGQSNTLPTDASLHVAFERDECSVDRYIDVRFARIRLKAGELKYDFLPEPCRLRLLDSGPYRKATDVVHYEAALLPSIFSKKCWQGMVVRGPRMFVAFMMDKDRQFHSAPMFVEISPTVNSPEYRDPVLEYPQEILELFFGSRTIPQVFQRYRKM
eukprot:m.335173 g.335173  ORF g.335173 m.335173 type:complete len:414 (+) comp17529_c0_seq1:369-1610(+)